MSNYPFRAVCSIVVFAVISLAPTACNGQASDQIAKYLAKLGHKSVDSSSDQSLNAALCDVIEKLPPGEAATAAPQILAHIQIAPDRQSRRYALALMIAISVRPDGPDLLKRYVSSFSDLLSDSDQVARRDGIYFLGTVGRSDPAAVTPPLLAVLSSQDAGTSVGPEAAVVLVSEAFNDPRVPPAIIQFLQRSDLTSDGRVDVINEIASKPLHTEALTRELLRNLSYSDVHVKLRTIVALSLVGPSLSPMVRPALESLSADVSMPMTVRHIASKALVHPLGDEPEARGESVHQQ